MSFFQNNQKYDTYIIDDSYFNNYESEITLPLIEIYNKDNIIFDFSNVKISSLDTNLKDRDIKINKILIDYGDGKQDLLNERLSNKGSTIGDFNIKKWQIVSHAFTSDKKHIYFEDLSLESHPQIKIIFFNQFNDKFYYSIPYKFLYKSFYDEGGDISLISANTNNRNITSFTLRERKNNTLLFVSSSSNVSIDEMVFTNPISFVDETDDYYIDDEDMVWNWSTIPELIILDPIIFPNDETNKYHITLEWKEKNVNLIDIKLKQRTLGKDDSSSISLENTENGDLPFSTTIEDVTPGVYEYTFDIKGINDLKNTQKIYIKATDANLCDMRFKNIPQITNAGDIRNKTFDICFYIPSGNPDTFEIFKKFDIVLTHEEKLLVYNYDVLNSDVISSESDIDNFYSFTIFSDVIPDGKYNISINLKDIKDNDAIYFKDKDGKDYDKTSPLSFTLNYIIGKFGDIKTNAIENVSDQQSSNSSEENPSSIPSKSITEKNIELSWNFFNNESDIEAGDADIFDIILEKTN